MTYLAIPVLAGSFSCYWAGFTHLLEPHWKSLPWLTSAVLLEALGIALLM